MSLGASGWEGGPQASVWDSGAMWSESSARPGGAGKGSWNATDATRGLPMFNLVAPGRGRRSSPVGGGGSIGAHGGFSGRRVPNYPVRGAPTEHSAQRAGGSLGAMRRA